MNKKTKQTRLSEQVLLSFTIAQLQSIVLHLNKKNLEDGTSVKRSEFIRTVVLKALGIAQ